MNIKIFSTKTLLISIIVPLLLCSNLLANKNELFMKVEENQSIQKGIEVLSEPDKEEKRSVEEQNSSRVSQKIKNFFSGFIDDLMEFAVDNKIINNK